MHMIFWSIIGLGTLYSFYYAYYLFKEKKNSSAVGLIFLGLLISGLSFFVRLK